MNREKLEITLDINSEKLLSFAQAAEKIPGGPNPSTVFRWSTRGVRGIKLEFACIGGRRFTSWEAIQRFVDRTTAAASGQSAPARTSRQRSRDIAQAEAELEAAGI